MDTDGQMLMAELQRDAIRFDKLADKAEQEAADYRRLAERARKGAEYIIKQAMVTQ